MVIIILYGYNIFPVYVVCVIVTTLWTRRDFETVIFHKKFSSARSDARSLYINGGRGQSVISVDDLLTEATTTFAPAAPRVHAQPETTRARRWRRVAETEAPSGIISILI